MADDFAALFPEDSDVVRLAPGQELFRKGEAGEHLFVVKSGALQVLDGNHVFATVESGGIVGEMALVGDKVRSATVKSVGDAVVIPVDEKRFLFLVQQTPFFAIRVMRVIGDRLKAMNHRATSLDA
jgi:CRP-like cAMP-binding protein